MACWIPGPYAMAWSAGKRRKAAEAKAAAEAAAKKPRKRKATPKAAEVSD